MNLLKILSTNLMKMARMLEISMLRANNKGKGQMIRSMRRKATASPKKKMKRKKEITMLNYYLQMKMLNLLLHL